MKLSKLNPLNWFKKESPIGAYLEKEFIQLSKADGKPGLSTSDLLAIAKRAAEANLPGLLSETKAENVELWAKGKFSNKTAQWAIGKLVQLGYLYAKEKLLIK